MSLTLNPSSNQLYTRIEAACLLETLMRLSWSPCMRVIGPEHMMAPCHTIPLMRRHLSNCMFCCRT